MNGLRISVVVPTFNRNEQLSEVLDSLLASEVGEFSDVEILVVDDGSPFPASEVVTSKEAVKPFRVHYLRQENSGPAVARNYGLMNSTNSIVLFVDDDVLLAPQTLRLHVLAHEENPHSVIFGPYPYKKPEQPTAIFRYLDMLESEPRNAMTANSDDEYFDVKWIASGNQSVERDGFIEFGGVYDPLMTIPMSEEIELANRLETLGIRMVFAPRLEAVHTQPISIEGVCIQNYKYGMGFAEAAAKLSLRTDTFKRVFRENGPIALGDGFALTVKKLAKSFLGKQIPRNGMLRFVQVMERIAPNSDRILFSVFRKTIGTFYFAGIRDGLRSFANG